MGVRDFRLLGASTLDAVRARAAAAVAAWAAQWGVGPDACEVHCARPAGELAGVAWDAGWQAGARQLWLASPPALQQALQHAMFGRDDNPLAPRAAPGQRATLAAARALDALGTALAGALLGEEDGQAARPGVPGQPPSHLLARGAGSLCITVAIGAASCRILLDGAGVASLAPAAPAAKGLAPVKLLKALDATPVRLEVRLGQAELGLSALMSVAVGDVIRLERAADAPVEVLAPGGGALLRAYPGQMQGMVAIEIDGRH
jgi:flagellar motor switch/type III secretory pathway protein FliN